MVYTGQARGGDNWDIVVFPFVRKYLYVHIIRLDNINIPTVSLTNHSACIRNYHSVKLVILSPLLRLPWRERRVHVTEVIGDARRPPEMAGEERREEGAVVVREEKDTYFVWLVIMFLGEISHSK